MVHPIKETSKVVSGGATSWRLMERKIREHMICVPVCKCVCACACVCVPVCICGLNTKAAQKALPSLCKLV